MAPRPAKTLTTTAKSALPPQPMLLFAGKGGVGKTTAAAATAVEILGQSRGDERILLFSTDPAHSLGDAFGVPVGNNIVQIANRKTAKLFAYEMDAEDALGRFKQKYGPTLAEIFERGTFLDKQDIDGLIGLPLPGIDEVMCLLELSDLAQAGEYSRIIVDTAPTGHTLRLLTLPRTFLDWVGALDSMSEKHRYMALQLTGAVRADDVDRFLNEFEGRAKLMNEILTDPKKSSVVMVTIPEVMAIEETARYLSALRRNHNFVSYIIVNRVEHGGHDCRYCRSRARAQKPILKGLPQQLDGLERKDIPVVSFSTVGMAGLRKFAGLLWQDADLEYAPSKLGREHFRPKRPVAGDAQGPRFELHPRRWFIFGGKGGVGKTTASCAAALALTDSDPALKVMVFSTDPAHSLSDSFDEQIGELKEGVAGRPNLDGMEIDAPARFARIRNAYNEFLDRAFGKGNTASTWTIEFDPEAMRGFLEAAPPGIDEILALTAIGDLLSSGKYDTVVVDSAPTGHLLRLLALPGVAQAWLHALMKLLLKYKEVVRWDGLVQELLSLSKSLKSTVSLMMDANATEFIGVATPELMILDESRRLASSLSTIKVPMRRLLINNVIPEWPAQKCGFCASRLKQQRACIEKFKSAFSGQAELYQAEQQPKSIQGAELLARHFSTWRRMV